MTSVLRRGKSYRFYLAQTIAAYASLRNRIVHEYEEIDPARIHRAPDRNSRRSNVPDAHPRRRGARLSLGLPAGCRSCPTTPSASMRP